MYQRIECLNNLVADCADFFNLALHYIPLLKMRISIDLGTLQYYFSCIKTDTNIIYLISNFQRTLRNCGGFMKTPTPGGVPVRITSPGRRVKNWVSQEINSSVLNTN